MTVFKTNLCSLKVKQWAAVAATKLLSSANGRSLFAMAHADVIKQGVEKPSVTPPSLLTILLDRLCFVKRVVVS